MTIRVSTCCWSSARPASAERARRAPSNASGLVQTPTVRMPLSRAALAITGAAPVPVPPPMPAAMKHMCAPSSEAIISSSVSSAAARPISGREPAPRPCVILSPSWIRRSAREAFKACASVLATTKSTPWTSARIMLAMALPPAPPTPITLIRGRSSSTSGRMKSMLMSLNLPQALQRVEPSGRIFESLRVASQAEKLTRTKKGGESVARKTHLSTISALIAVSAANVDGPGVTALERQVDRASADRPGAMDDSFWDGEQVALAEYDLPVLELDHELALDDEENLIRSRVAVPLEAGGHHAHADFMVVGRRHAAVVIRRANRAALAQRIDCLR